jgi:pilus assembly protein CpaE
MRQDLSKLDLQVAEMVGASQKQVLLITPDAAVKDAIQSALTGLTGVNVRTEVSSVAGLNGRMAQVAADKDIIIFETTGDDASDIEVIQALSTARRAGAKLLALADSGITLSRVRALNNAGVDEVLPSPIPSSAPAGPRRLAAPEQPALQQGRIIAVAQARGGVGATTVAVNLADELVGRSSFLKKRLPNSVALVDLDLQFGSVGALLDLGEQDALLQLALDGAVPDAAFLEASMVRRPNGLRVLAAPSKFMPLDSLQPEQIAAILDLLRRDNDFVVVDLPHALGQWIEPVLKRADELLIVSDTSVPSIRHCRRLIDFFTADNPNLPSGSSSTMKSGLCSILRCRKRRRRP